MMEVDVENIERRQGIFFYRVQVSVIVIRVRMRVASDGCPSDQEDEQDDQMAWLQASLALFSCHGLQDHSIMVV